MNAITQDALEHVQNTRGWAVQLAINTLTGQAATTAMSAVDQAKAVVDFADVLVEYSLYPDAQKVADVQQMRYDYELALVAQRDAFAAAADAGHPQANVGDYGVAVSANEA